MSNWVVQFDASSIEKRVNDAAGNALDQIASELLAESQQLCPKERGFNGGLVSTAKIEIDKENLSVKLSYSAPHAHLQHEKLNYKHKNGEQAKFVEVPLLRNAQRYFAQIGSSIKTEMSR